jgi:hypothetical protein
MQGDLLFVQKGRLFPEVFSVPRQAIVQQDAQGVVLNLSKDFQQPLLLCSHGLRRVFPQPRLANNLSQPFPDEQPHSWSQPYPN